MINEVVWRWNNHKLQWEILDQKSGMWFFEHKALPDWFVQSQAILEPQRFIEIWQSASFLNDVKKELFWLNLEEILLFWQDINQFLESQEIVLLPELHLEKGDWIEKEALSLLLENGTLEKEPFAQKSSDQYDPMLALLQAQHKHNSQEHSHIETVEVSGRYRFQAKH